MYPFSEKHPMLDHRYLRRNIKEVAERLAIKGFELDQKFIEEREIQRKKIQVETEKFQGERNLSSKKIGKLKSEGKEVGELLNQVASIGERLDKSKIELEKIQNELNEYYLNIPNIPDISVPPGDSESDNIEIRKWGEVQQTDFDQKDHVDLTTKSNSLSFDDAAKISVKTGL